MANNANKLTTPMNSDAMRMLRSMLLAVSLSFLFACGGDDPGGNGDPQGNGSTPSSDSNLSSSSIAGGSGLCAGFTVGTAREHYGKQKKQFCDGRDGNKYVYVDIGAQTWMAENLNYDAFNSVCHDNNCDAYGRFYNWATAMDNAISSNAAPSGVQGVCPEGWHLPSDEEWKMLATVAGGNVNGLGAGTKLKAASGWDGSNSGADDYGFAALPGGYYNPNGSGSFSGIGASGNWWSATQGSAAEAYRR